MKHKILSLALLILSSAIGVSSFANHNQIVESKALNVSSGDTIASYYSTIDDSLSGTNLLNALHTLNTSKKKKEVTYNGLKTFYQKSDIDPNGSGKILGFYDNALVGPSWDSANTWNREHVWPDSRGGNLVEGDAYMARPASVDTNGGRGNSFYAESGAYDPGYKYKEYRGIAARIIFYCAIANTSLTLVDKVDDNKNNKTMGKLSDLLKWNLEYLPSSDTTALKAEQNRNDVIQNDSSGQGNRNPFVDHPEYACKIWGNTNETTKEICKNQVVVETKTLTNLTVSGTPSRTEYEAGERFISTGLTVTATYSDKSTSNVTSEVVWSPSVLKEGMTSVTGSYTYEGVTKTVTVSGLTVSKATYLGLYVTGELTKKVYKTGESFNPDGLTILAKFSDKSFIDVTNEVTWTELRFGMTKVIGTYTIGEVTKSCIIEGITVEQGGCTGSIYVTSIALSVLSISVLGFILLRKKHIKE